MSDFVNFVYDKAVDYIENRARDNDLRSAYADYMSKGNWNNNEMANVVEVIAVIAEDELRGSRSEREDEATIRDVIMTCIDANCGSFGLSDRQFANSVPDDVYSDMKRADAKWNDILNRLSGNTRGGGRNTQRSGGGQSRQWGGGGSSRSVFDRGNQYGDRRSGFDRNEPQDERASNSVFAGRDVPRGSSPVFDRNQDERERSQSTPRSAFAQTRERPPAPEQTRREEPVRQPDRPAREEQVERGEGPDMSQERPYDDFWMKGENWQIAHRSKFTWSWSQKQQSRRAYDPDNEVRFLVKGVDGQIREEFIQMTDDLVEEAHAIRAQQRPNRPRTTTERFEGDDIFEGQDLDVVDLDALQITKHYAAKELLSELDISSPFISEQAISVATIEEAAVRVAGDATKNEGDVTATNNIMSIQLAGDATSIKALESVKAIGVNEGDLLQLQKRLKSLRGTLAENVMNYLDKHFTIEVNSALGDQFGLAKPRIESFIEDFEDLLNCNTFKKQGTAYATQFLSRTRILLASMQYLTEDDLREEFMECTDLLVQGENDPEAYTAFRKNMVVLFKPVAMIHIKLLAEQLGFVDQEVRVPRRTGEGADPTLCDTLNGLYAIGRKTAGAGRVYVVSADNLIFELVPISGARDIIGIRTV
ncbi:hypothetical protein D3C81_21300 [compost metagenome]